MEALGVVIGVLVVGLIILGQYGSLFERRHPRHVEDAQNEHGLSSSDPSQTHDLDDERS